MALMPPTADLVRPEITEQLVFRKITLSLFGVSLYFLEKYNIFNAMISLFFLKYLTVCQQT